ncbi:MAG TPA: YegS/Rv2252/BmrU family lipid kinase [Acidimicrobiales bacterium]|nr:YegS/Rv2252/BmrU family lipid kinase [Acidimicrobiales bacterium]
MTSPFGRLCLIVNPKAGGKGAGGPLAEVVRALDGLGLDHDVEMTAGPGDASRIARRRLEDGCRFVVAVGGDGTVHEVVNGMVDEGGRPVAGDAVLGVVPAGSGCDYVRTFDLPSAPAEAAARLAGDAVQRVDVARIGYLDAAGQPARRCFANIAETGLGATTAVRAARLPRWLGVSRYLVAFWAVLPGYRAGTARVEVDGEVAYEGRVVNVVVANARFFGGAMQISPRSQPSDGLLEALVFTGPRTDSFTRLPKVYRGRHVPHRNIVELAGRHFRVEPERPLDVEADGEVLGTTPLTVEVVPGALTLKI